MVHTETADSSSFNSYLKPDLESMEWRDNVAFSSIDKGLVEQLRDRRFSLKDYLRWCSILDALPTFWNSALVSNVSGKMWGFMYGRLNPLEREMEIKRISIDPALMTFRGEFMLKVYEHVKEIGKELGVLCIYCVTPYWKAFLRKLPKYLRVSDTKILEVI